MPWKIMGVTMLSSFVHIINILYAYNKLNTLNTLFFKYFKNNLEKNQKNDGAMNLGVLYVKIIEIYSKIFKLIQLKLIYKDTNI